MVGEQGPVPWELCSSEGEACGTWPSWHSPPLSPHWVPHISLPCTPQAEVQVWGGCAHSEDRVLLCTSPRDLQCWGGWLGVLSAQGSGEARPKPGDTYGSQLYMAHRYPKYQVTDCPDTTPEAPRL